MQETGSKVSWLAIWMNLSGRKFCSGKISNRGEHLRPCYQSLCSAVQLSIIDCIIHCQGTEYSLALHSG